MYIMENLEAILYIAYPIDFRYSWQSVADITKGGIGGEGLNALSAVPRVLSASDPNSSGA
jgi:hypothetical protein